MTAPKRHLKDYCYTGGAPAAYGAGVMFFREHESAIRRCVVHVEELHALDGFADAQMPAELERIFRDYMPKIVAAADDQILHGDDRETVIIKKIFLDL